MSERETTVKTDPVYYRLISVWVLCEAMLGGIIHGLKIPVSGLIVGSSAVVCISLIAWYVPNKGAILKATLIVAIFKMMLSPQAPPPAYIAVFFQGLMGELLFRHKRFFKLSCIIFAIIALLESGLQRILVLTIVYGDGLWTSVNGFINRITKQKAVTNYSLFIGAAYVMLHLIAGVFTGMFAALLPGRIRKWRTDPGYQLEPIATINGSLHAATKKKRLKKIFLVIWVLLLGLYVQSYYRIGTPLLPAHVSLKILLRSLVIILGWIFIIGPLMTRILHRWLKKRQGQSQLEIQELLALLPYTRGLIAESWKRSAINKGAQRLGSFCKMVLVNIISPTESRKIGSNLYLLTAPIQSGKTSSLLNWVANRKDVYGILTPVVNGKRVFHDLQTGEQFPMEAGPGETETLSVGRFLFSKKNFEKAIAVIRDGINKPGWLIIDEIGPLELRGEGFSEVLNQIVAHRIGSTLLVVREGLTRELMAHFQLAHVHKITEIANLEEIGS